MKGAQEDLAYESTGDTCSLSRSEIREEKPDAFIYKKKKPYAERPCRVTSITNSAPRRINLFRFLTRRARVHITLRTARYRTANTNHKYLSSFDQETLDVSDDDQEESTTRHFRPANT